jgi:mycolipenoyl-CoA---2-(long-chain-fatty acyl)-trehalose mycolipenoyltransferase / long-chain-acyl-CoA---trehalose acyltransferase
VLPETGSFLEHCAAEREHGATIGADDPTVGRWRDFVRACGGTAPTFPLDLGVEAGQSWPQSVYNRVLLSAQDAAAFDTACQRAGGTFFAGVLAAMAIVIREMTGQEDFRSITPLHTRYRSRWRAAMGWFITCAPLEFSLTGVRGFAELIPRAQVGVRNALAMAHYPAARVLELLGDDFRITRRDLFSMVSYTDYRKMPGADRYTDWNPTTIGQVTQADDSHVWTSRLHDGLHIAIRHPHTPLAAEVLDEYTDLVAEVLGRVAVAGDYRLAASWADLAPM